MKDNMTETLAGNLKGLSVTSILTVSKSVLSTKHTPLYTHRHTQSFSLRFQMQLKPFTLCNIKEDTVMSY